MNAATRDTLGFHSLFSCGADANVDRLSITCLCLTSASLALICRISFEDAVINFAISDHFLLPNNPRTKTVVFSISSSPTPHHHQHRTFPDCLAPCALASLGGTWRTRIEAKLHRWLGQERDCGSHAATRRCAPWKILLEPQTFQFCV